MAHTTSGHLLIADISGYTHYLTSSELEHAQQVLGSLMELLIDHTLPPLRVAGLQGDAVFSYGIASGALGGQTLVEMIETTYVAFRRAIEQMVLNTTCRCNACANISTLDLKFLVHHGTFSISPLRGKDELVGSAVIEIHRLLKNHITEATGVRAYTAYTAAAVDALGLDGFTDNLIPHTEAYPDLGTLSTWVQDMHPVWEDQRDDSRVRVNPDDALAGSRTTFPSRSESPGSCSCNRSTDRSCSASTGKTRANGSTAASPKAQCSPATTAPTWSRPKPCWPCNRCSTSSPKTPHPSPARGSSARSPSSPAAAPPPSPSPAAGAEDRGCPARSTTSSAAG